jgi:hypothetical protein
MIKALHILLLLLSSIGSHFAVAQSIEFSQNQYHFLFTFQNESFLILDDSVYCVSGDKEGFPKVNDFVMKEFKFVSNDSLGFLKNASSGVVYSFDGNEFKRLDNSFPYKSQFISFSFIHENNLMDFGGYGLHTYKNIITYFNLNKKETELYKVNTPIPFIPIPRDRMVGQYSNGNLYIGTGHGYSYVSENPYDIDIVINDFWKFSFNTNEWEKLGEGMFSPSNPYSVMYDFNGNSLLLSTRGVHEYDIQNNILIDYPNADIDVLKTFHMSATLYDVTYNKMLDGFFMVINKQNRNAGVIFIKRTDFLGTKRVISPIYEANNTSNGVLYAIIGMLVIITILSILVYKRKKKTVADLILSMSDELQKELKSEDFKVLIKIASADPGFINYTELMDSFSNQLGYESKKKKLRLTLLFLEDYLEDKLKLESPVFKTRQNVEDKREKQVRLNSNK